MCARNLYNMALAERKHAYQIEGRSVKLADLEQLAKRYRAMFPYAMQMFSQTAQSVVKQVDTAFQGFFRRVKAGQTPGYPRFKNAMGFNSFEFKQYGSGAKRVVGMDVGISALLTTSDGEKVANPNYYHAGQITLRILQRKLARAKRGSKNRRKIVRAVQRQHEHVANQRRGYLHKLSTQLVQTYDGIALENLRVRNMVRNHHLSKSILDSGWTIFKDMLTYKAESAGRKMFFVNPAYTPKQCSNCGSIFEGMTLATRWITCNCGLSLDRDHNAAINILKKSGWDAPVPDNVERSHGSCVRQRPPPLGVGSVTMKFH